MAMRWLFATLHLLALGIGLGAVWGRGRALRVALDAAGLRRVFYADNWWGIAALLWLATGLMRAFAGLEKGTAYYLNNHVFWAKMGLFLVIFLLELWPMLTLLQWRRQVRRGEQPETRAARQLARISVLEAVLVVLIAMAATAMARGYGFLR